MSFVGDLRTVLRGSGFRRLFGVRLLGQAADGCFQVALGSYVFFDPTKATTASKAAAAFAVLLLPYSLVGPFAGVLLDRWSRQRVLVLVNLLRAFMVLGVAALVAVHDDGPAFFAAALAVVSVNRFVLAALSAALPHVVDEDELVMGNSVSTTSGTVIAIVGGGIGYGIRNLLGPGEGADALVMVTAAAVYLAASFAATSMAWGALGPDQRSERPGTTQEILRVVYGLVDGARHVWQQKPARYALAAITAHRFFYGLSTIAAVLLYRNYFNDSGGSDDGLGGLALIVASSGLGFFVAAIITPVVTRRMTKESWISWLLIGALVVEAVLCAPYDNTLFIVAAFFLGLVAQGVKICVDTIVQETIEDAFRGRVFSFYDVLFNVAFVAAAAAGVLLLPMNGKSYLALALVSVGYGVAGISYRLAVNRMRRSEYVQEQVGTPTPAGA